MTAQEVLYLYLSIIGVSFILERYLDWINLKNWRAEVPEHMKPFYNEEKYAKARAYQLESKQLGNISTIVSTTVLVLVLLSGFLGIIDEWTRDVSQDSFTRSALFFLVVWVGSDLLSLPFSIYGTFVIEEKYGFNKSSVATFISDKIKGYLIGAIIGGLMLYAVMWFYESNPSTFWLWAWALITAFSMITMMFYTSVLLPIFNKLSPLEDGELRAEIETYCNKIGYKLNRIFVMDGSKRSTRANAFFSGLGARKTIVLYDTLIENHTKEEVVAVLAHEVGHYKKNHTLQGLVLSVLNTGITLFLLSIVIGEPIIAEAFGGEPAFHFGVLGFAFLFSPLSAITGYLINALSRKNEFEADKFAKETYDGASLANALRRLSADNYGNLYPHPLYVKVYYSHPPVLKRIEAIES